MSSVQSRLVFGAQQDLEQVYSNKPYVAFLTVMRDPSPAEQLRLMSRLRQLKLMKVAFDSLSLVRSFKQ